MGLRETKHHSVWPPLGRSPLVVHTVRLTLHRAQMHKEALLSMRGFWTSLLHNSVSFDALTKSVRMMDLNVRQAERVYRYAHARLVGQHRAAGHGVMRYTRSRGVGAGTMGEPTCCDSVVV